MPTFRAKERRSSNRPGCFGCSGKPGLSEVRERGTGRRPSERVLRGGGRFLGGQAFAESMGAEKDVEVPRPKAKSRIDRGARNLGNYLDIEVSVLRGADRSGAVSKARKQVAYV